MPILRPLASAGKRACWLLMGLCLGLPALANESAGEFQRHFDQPRAGVGAGPAEQPRAGGGGARDRDCQRRAAAGRADPQPGSVLERRGHPPGQSPDQRQHRPAAGAGRQARCAGGGGETRQRDRLDPTGSPSRRTARPGPRRLLRGADRAGAGAPGEDLPGPGQARAAGRRPTGQGRQHLLGGTGSRPGPGGQRPARPEPGGAGAAAHLSCSCRAPGTSRSQASPGSAARSTRCRRASPVAPCCAISTSRRPCAWRPRR